MAIAVSERAPAPRTGVCLVTRGQVSMSTATWSSAPATPSTDYFDFLPGLMHAHADRLQEL
jgi:hypothetical protein